MADPFEYDVFLSFSSEDEEIVKPIWQELCSNGLRVFWSDATLKKEVGNSWFEVIEKSLERSKHMLLVCSENSMSSPWVQREYRAFFDLCSFSNARRLIPILTRRFKPSDLPLFLRQLQVGKINDPDFLQEIIPVLGGVNIEQLRKENQSLREQLNDLLCEKTELSEELKTAKDAVQKHLLDLAAAIKQRDELLEENKFLRETEAGGQKKLNVTYRPSPPRPRDMTKLFVQNLDRAFDNNELSAVFSQAGTVKFIRIISSANETSKAYVVMSSAQEAQRAIVMLNGRKLNGRSISVELA